MVAELFRKAILDDQNVHGASKYPGQLLWQNNYFLFLLTLAVVFTFFAFFFALRRFGNRASPLLIYLVCIITIYVALCIKKARSSRSGVYGDERFYRSNHSRLSFSEKLIAAANSDYLGKRIVYLLSNHLQNNDAGSKAIAGFVSESDASSENEEGNFSGKPKEVSENHHGHKPNKNESEISIARRNEPQIKHSIMSPLVNLEQSNSPRNSYSGHNTKSTSSRDTEDRDVKSSKNDNISLDAKKHRNKMHMHEFKDASTADKGRRTAEKNESADDKGDFFHEIQRQVENKKRIDSQLDKFKKSIQIARAHAASLVETLRKDYRVFCALSQSINGRLLSTMGISTDLYAYELDELEEEIVRKYTLHEEGNIRNREAKRSESKDRKVMGLSSENPSIRQGTNSQVLDALRRIKDTKLKLVEDRNKSQDFDLIKQKLQVIEFYLTFESIVSLILIMMILAEMYEYVAILRFVLIIALLVNIYIGIFILADGKILESHCQRRMLEGCKQGTHEVNDIVQLLNQDAKLEHQVDVINKEFSRISSGAKQQIQAIRKYLVGSLNSRADVKILVFETFIDKLKSIEENFDEVMGDSIDKVAFYNTVDAMKRDLENIKGFTKSMNVAKILDVYQGLFQVEYFFGNERKRVAEKVKSIVDADTNELGRKKRQKCIDFIEGICNSQKEHDNLSFILVFFPILFVVLLLL